MTGIVYSEVFSIECEKQAFTCLATAISALKIKTDVNTKLTSFPQVSLIFIILLHYNFF